MATQLIRLSHVQIALHHCATTTVHRRFCHYRLSNSTEWVQEYKRYAFAKEA